MTTKSTGVIYGQIFHRPDILQQVAQEAHLLLWRLNLRILQINTFDVGGGAERVALQLNASFRAADHDSWLAVKRRRSGDPNVIQIPEGLGLNFWGRIFSSLAQRFESSAKPITGVSFLASLCRDLARPAAFLDRYFGVEDFRFPATTLMPSLLEQPPDLLICHNLHGGYFDLAALPTLAAKMPVFLLLHDSWLFSGHCAHSFECALWKTGCGPCPDLGIYPAVRRDSTASNWARKRDIYARSRLYVAAPSNWMMTRVHESVLAPAISDSRVIHNSIDDAFFQPCPKEEARGLLGVPANATVLLFAANSIRENRWKDFQTLRQALEIVDKELPAQGLVLLAVGETAPNEQVGSSMIQFVPFQNDPARMSLYYRAADIYLHAARVESFSLTLAEAMACGLPCIATAIGAIPERIRGLDHPASARGLPTYPMSLATGILTQPEDPRGMASAVVALLRNPGLRALLGGNASELARQSYSSHTQTAAYLDWFSDVVSATKKKTS